MKIKYTNSMSRKMPATVWHNETEHVLTPGETVTLSLHRDDKVSYRVGRFNQVHPINYQNSQADFQIEVNSRLQMIYFAVLVAALLVLYFMNNVNEGLLTVLVLVGLLGYEGILYFKGYVAKPLH